MEKETTTPAKELTPYQKTQEMMRRLLAVPKSEPSDTRADELNRREKAPAGAKKTSPSK